MDYNDAQGGNALLGCGRCTVPPWRKGRCCVCLLINPPPLPKMLLHLLI